MKVPRKQLKQTFKERWLGEEIEAVVGKKISKYRYYGAAKKHGLNTADKLVLYFPNGVLSISPDLVGKELELVISFTPRLK